MPRTGAVFIVLATAETLIRASPGGFSSRAWCRPLLGQVWALASSTPDGQSVLGSTTRSAYVEPPTVRFPSRWITSSSALQPGLASPGGRHVAASVMN